MKQVLEIGQYVEQEGKNSLGIILYLEKDKAYVLWEDEKIENSWDLLEWNNIDSLTLVTGL